MRKLFIVTLALAATSAFAAEYKVDPGHSRVGFEIKHLFSKVPGKFNEFEGTVSFDEKKVAASKVDFTIKTASIDTDNEKRDGHLKGADFFDAEKNATITFKSTKVTGSGKKFKLAGDMTLHGVTKPVVFDVEHLGTDKDPWGTTKAGFTAKSKIKRKDFGIVWNKTLDSGNLLLGDDVELNLAIEADLQK